MTQTVLITGASSGIGKASVEIFGLAGWNVAATSRKIDKKLFDSFPNVQAYTMDVNDKSSIEKAFDDVVAHFGTIDVVVNNAGYALEGAFEMLTDEQIEQQFRTNVFGLMSVTREAIAVMRPKGSGKIIQVASMGGRLTMPLYSIYHSSKWAVEGFSESLQYELRQFGLQIKIIEPGVIKTDFYKSSVLSTDPDKEMGYGNFVEKIEAAIQRTGSKGGPPEQVAKTILKAATSNSNKIRYIVGAPAPILLALRKILPERLFYALVRANFRI